MDESVKVAPTRWRVKGPKKEVRAKGSLIYFVAMESGKDYHLSDRVTRDFGGRIVGVDPPVPALEADEHLEYY